MARIPDSNRGKLASAETAPPANTDVQWEEWGRRDPYFAVCTAPRFRRNNLTVGARDEFFATGEAHVQFVFEFIRQVVDSRFSASRILDFGCGVGRTLIPFARIASTVVGADVSPSMLAEARRNLDAAGIANVALVVSNDALSTLEGPFDLVHSCLVFQHIPVERGRALVKTLLGHLAPGGIGALQLTYAKSIHAQTHGTPPLFVGPKPTPPAIEPGQRPADPEMQMNSYNLSEIFFHIQRSGVQRLHAEFTDHGGELGVFLFFQKSTPGAPGA